MSGVSATARFQVVVPPASAGPSPGPQDRLLSDSGSRRMLEEKPEAALFGLPGASCALTTRLQP